MKYLAIVVLIVFIIVSNADNPEQEDPATSTQMPVPKNEEEFKSLYIKLLQTKRKAHKEAIKRIQDLNNTKKEKEMLNMVIKKLFETLLVSLQKLSQIQSESKEMKMDQKFVSEISIIIENTAFASDLALFFPDMFHKLYDKNDNWHILLQSAIGFSIKTGLVDEETDKAINLMSQELNIINRDPNFVNPYRKKRKDQNVAVEETENVSVKDKKQKKKRNRGPGLSGGRNEL